MLIRSQSTKVYIVQHAQTIEKGIPMTVSVPAVKFSRAVIAALLLATPPALAADSVIDLDDYQGKVVVVDFWASWCVPCRRSFPWLDEMQGKYRQQGLVVIGVNMDADASAAESFLQEFPVSFRIVRDADGTLARQYDVMVMPSSYVIDRDGNVVARHLGFKTAKMHEYEATLLAVINDDETVISAR